MTNIIKGKFKFKVIQTCNESNRWVFALWNAHLVTIENFDLEQGNYGGVGGCE